MSRHITGMPGRLPPGEHILWQGRPAWRPLARRLCYAPAVATYLAVLAAGDAALRLIDGQTLPATALALAPLMAAGTAVIAFLLALAWLVARSTEYTLTTRRIVMQIGIALPATLAIPHSGIAHAGLRLDRDGTGDIPLQTKPGFAVALHRVWPHSRPGRWRRAHPMLRSIPEAATVAALLAQTLARAENERRQPPPMLIAAE